MLEAFYMFLSFICTSPVQSSAAINVSKSSDDINDFIVNFNYFIISYQGM